MVEKAIASSMRPKIFSYRYSGKWSANLATITWTSKPGVGILASGLCYRLEVSVRGQNSRHKKTTQEVAFMCFRISQGEISYRADS